MTYRVVTPFVYEVLDGGRHMPARIDGTWKVVAVRDGWVQLQKETGDDCCSYDGVYVSVPMVVFENNFRSEGEAAA